MRAADGLFVRHDTALTNEIGRWNEAWGPEPHKVKDKPLPRVRPNKVNWHYGWCRIGCEASCVNAGPFVVRCPVNKGHQETYVCSACGRRMWQSDAAP